MEELNKNNCDGILTKFYHWNYMHSQFSLELVPVSRYCETVKNLKGQTSFKTKLDFETRTKWESAEK